MSITVHIYYSGQGENAKDFAREMAQSGTLDAVRAEDGCESYEYFYPVDNPETVLLIVRWVDQAAIDFHHKTPMMQEIARLREKYKLHMRVSRYTDLPK